MKNRILLLGPLVYLFSSYPRVMRAQPQPRPFVSEAPVLPMDIKFRYSPQYFEQSSSDDPRYARIVALADHGHSDVILFDKTTNREAFYSTLDRKVQALAASGADADTRPIDFTASSTIDSYALFSIHFQDRFGQKITWQFMAGEILPHASPEVISRSDSSGITLMCALRRAPAVTGTALTIAARTYRPESTPSRDPLGVFYATDMTVG